MAGHAGGNRRNAGKFGGLHRGVAVAAGNAVVADVVLVAERHRLFDWLVDHVGLVDQSAPGEKTRRHEDDYGEQCQRDKKAERAMEQLAQRTVPMATWYSGMACRPEPTGGGFSGPLFRGHRPHPRTGAAVNRLTCGSD